MQNMQLSVRNGWSDIVCVVRPPGRACQNCKVQLLVEDGEGE